MSTPGQPVALQAQDWDAVVVGAGVAGAVSAFRLARHGLRVLLIEKSRWPRDKACGGCLNAAALHQLDALGLGDIAADSPEYSRLALGCGVRGAELTLPLGRALSRRELDERLVARAQAEGAVFLPSTQAILETAERGDPVRRVRLSGNAIDTIVSARLVLACDGLGSRLLREAVPNDLHVDSTAHIGLGATLDDAPEPYCPGTIHMACGPHGYVGLVRVEEGRINVGAALDPRWVKQQGSPAAAVAAVLRQAQFPVWEGLNEAQWQGTPRLTRQRSHLGAEGVLVLGDAAGYVEPFTGEGMSWALASVAALEPLALDAIETWRHDHVAHWTQRHSQLLSARQRGCLVVTRLLRRPRLVSAMLPVIAAMPGITQPAIRWLNRPYPTTSTLQSPKGVP
ncbi:NAD(P)/FAD-dependent oxidoreductase [Litchfieldella xinjiangensis]|uniref:NAD(P)/FAD-dependent oxidoreductase n=1 Tax=Litchfieldella xinjiangensis TaxID=1166948 RepID=UPI0006946F5A|nr:NAD(P)/FAD-dependent oxidoreductase [Halomonas xinjiangensis]